MVLEEQSQWLHDRIKFHNAARYYFLKWGNKPVMILQTIHKTIQSDLSMVISSSWSLELIQLHPVDNIHKLHIRQSLVNSATLPMQREFKIYMEVRAHEHPPLPRLSRR